MERHLSGAYGGIGVISGDQPKCSPAAPPEEKYADKNKKNNPAYTNSNPSDGPPAKSLRAQFSYLFHNTGRSDTHEDEDLQRRTQVSSQKHDESLETD